MRALSLARASSPPPLLLHLRRALAPASSSSPAPVLLLRPAVSCSSLFVSDRAAAARRSSGSSRRSMASQQFPPQNQETQPGKEHAMDPRPEAIIQSYKPANKLKDKVAIVTGGDSGIGRAVCLCFALEGATVAFTYVKGQEEKDAEETLRALRDIRARTGAKDPMAIPADLGYDDNCRKVVDEVAGAYGGAIDILVNNAAEQYERPSITDITEDDLERVFRTNIFSYFFMSKHAVKRMRDRRGGAGAGGCSIINTSSINAYKGNKTLLDYTATKGAIVAFTRALALQLAEEGIRVNGVAPGPIWTPLIPASFAEEKVRQFGSQVPMGRAGQPSEVAPSFVFLASDDASYMSGQMLHVNGGVIVNG
ncbi:Os05g0140800 [Oryza sativa Japonica Group]|nr:putative NAD-/NADP-dependent oxidoreductase [Oryza sativa Japonica Group]AAU10779.1 putative NAD-/NADP-dependent oxidoreductase [Oryza sativa Japonica Group]BAF16514.1 Os05g0140800 [Oryza sativa Japonica Group]BAS92193.1 Os05g0140800 [Oryza sativa Japonica Group]|eukprot:NP_001054600.1 Os05g0140800 [Oryza sativa Japonica Group]